MILWIEDVNFKLSLAVISGFSDMTYEKRKILNSFRNTRYGNKLSCIVKSVDRWVMETLKSEKIFSLHWYSSNIKWNLRYFNKINFKIEKELVPEAILKNGRVSAISFSYKRVVKNKYGKISFYILYPTINS